MKLCALLFHREALGIPYLIALELATKGGIFTIEKEKKKKTQLSKTKPVES